MKRIQKLCFILMGIVIFSVANAQNLVPVTTKFAAVTEPLITYDQFIVTYREDSAQRSNRTAALQTVQTALDYSLPLSQTHEQKSARVEATYMRKLLVGADLIHTSRKLDQRDANRFMEHLASNPVVQYVEPDAVLSFDDPPISPNMLSKAISAKVAQQDFPNDPEYDLQEWQFGDGLGGIQLPQAWEQSSVNGGKGIVVAVLDTGITKHPDLDTSLANDGYDFISEPFISGRFGQPNDGRVPGGWDTGDWTTTEPWLSACTDSDGNPDNQPSSWHGTHVAGTIAELTNNGIDGAGVAYNAKVLPVRVLGHCGGLTSDIVDGIVWAAGVPRADYAAANIAPNKYPADVINMSLGGQGHCNSRSVDQQAIDLATKQGAVVVVAAGNEDQDANNVTPASCQGVITVAATDSNGKRADYSNYGKDVTLAAPGGGGPANGLNGYVWSTLNDGKKGPGNPIFNGAAGTSMAAPHVTGVVALMIAARRAANLPKMSPAAVKQYLQLAARKFPDPDPNKPIGAGILNAYTSVCLSGFCSNKPKMMH